MAEIIELKPSAKPTRVTFPALIFQFPRPDQRVPPRLAPSIIDIIDYCDAHGARPIYSDPLSGSLEIEAAQWLKNMGLGRLLVEPGGSLIFTPDPERIDLVLLDQELTRRWQQRSAPRTSSGSH